MKAPFFRFGPTRRFSRFVVVLLCVLIAQPAQSLLLAQQVTSHVEPLGAKFPAEHLDSLVAPIALYPDPMLAQVLAASTYPLEIVELQQWLQRNPEMRVLCVIDREDIVAAAKFMICHEDAVPLYEQDLMTSFKAQHFVLGAEFERYFCVVLTPQPRLAEVD